MSSYARQFLGLMEKPNVELIEGLSPAISIDQKTTSKNPRSTVGTVTEIYDYIRLLYARIGVPHCPNCGKKIEKQTIDQVVDSLMELEEGTKIQVFAPVVRGRKGEYTKLLEDFSKEGFVRVRVDGQIYELTDDIEIDRKKKHNIDIIVDRLVIKDDIRSRLTESVETAFKYANNLVLVGIGGTTETRDVLYSQNYACPDCNISFEELFDSQLLFITRAGFIKLVSGVEFETNRQTIASTKLAEGDELVCVQQVGIEDVINADRKVIVITDQGLSLGFPLLEVGELKKTSRGVKGITLIGDDLVKHAGFVTPDMERIDFDGKAINPKKIRSRKRAAKGQKSQIGTK